MKQPPYYAVIFISQQTDFRDGYAEMSDRMSDLASEQAGFLGIESFRSPDKKGITVSYWKDLPSIDAWRQNSEHQTAQELGKNKWYQNYTIEIAKVETVSESESG